MKHLSDLTIKEYYEYLELIEEKDLDWYSICKLFGGDFDKMSAQEYELFKNDLLVMTLDSMAVYDFYTINGTTYKLHKAIHDLKAAQFIDFQTLIQRNKIHEILSVFLIPTTTNPSLYAKVVAKITKNPYKGLKANDYGMGYDALKVQDDILNHLTIGEAHSLSTFFLRSSTHLYQVMTSYLEMKTKEMEKPQKPASRIQDWVGCKLSKILRK